MIPKKIHYCWFGGQPLPQSVEKCLSTWQEKCPDYEIILWNEDNYDVHQNVYISQAYQAGKYAFVSDYARLDIIEQYGGIYLDTDVEVLRDLTPLLQNKCYFGCELLGEVSTGIGFGAEAHHWFIQENKQAYLQREFKITDQKYDLTTCVQITTELLKKYGVQKIDQVQKIQDIVIYPPSYFCPYSLITKKTNIQPETYTIHHYDATWYSQTKWKRQIHIALIPYKIKLRHLLNQLVGDGTYERLKNKIKRGK